MKFGKANRSQILKWWRALAPIKQEGFIVWLFQSETVRKPLAEALQAEVDAHEFLRELFGKPGEEFSDQQKEVRADFLLRLWAGNIGRKRDDPDQKRGPTQH